MPSPDVEPVAVAELIDLCARELSQAELHFGHGTDNAGDEAAALVMAAAGLDFRDPAAWEARLDSGARARVAAFLRRRIDQRLPLPYITGEAWFAGLRFKVDRRVLIPRSPFAELIQSRFQPWLPSKPVSRILDLCTGCGCMAVAAAMAFPESRILASDISMDALQLAAENLRAHGVDDRVHLVVADLFEGLEAPGGGFDLIISNPPYVPVVEIEKLPLEYAHEPRLALESGADGMELPRRILQDAGRFLAQDGWLALEVGAWSQALEAAFPRLPFIWPELESGGEGIALLAAAELDGSAGRVE